MCALDRIVSACLAGKPCRYDGATCADPRVLEWVRQGLALPVCPEVLGGLPTPRTPCEILGGDGTAVWTGEAKVIDARGHDRTCAFLQGATETLRVCRTLNIEKAWLKNRSPSCGCGILYDGTFTDTLTTGWGVAACILKNNGVSVHGML